MRVRTPPRPGKIPLAGQQASVQRPDGGIVGEGLEQRGELGACSIQLTTDEETADQQHPRFSALRGVLDGFLGELDARVRLARCEVEPGQLGLRRGRPRVQTEDFRHRFFRSLAIA